MTRRSEAARPAARLGALWLLLGFVVGEGCGPGSEDVRPLVETAPERPVSNEEARSEAASARAPSIPEVARDEVTDCTLVDPPPGFVDLRELIPSAILVVGYHGEDNFTGAPLPGYEAEGAWLEAEAAAALAGVAARLRAEGLRLMIFDAYRPRRASEAMVAWCRREGREDLLAEGWIAARSAHGRGRAVDLGLADDSGRPLDMGSPWDHFARTSHLRGVEGEALKLRLRLRDELVRAGFRPYAREWWHFGFPGEAPAPIRDVPYACVEADARHTRTSRGTTL
jgi:D-alanyl-D-alanine dipeptidase